MADGTYNIQITDCWWSKARISDTKFAMKLHDVDGSFVGAVNIPTVYYPLNGKMRVFTFDNTKVVSDEAVLRLFDKARYDIGACYSNTERLAALLSDAGYDVKTYVGWLFTGDGTHPIHHCWAVLNDESILDLSDDFSVMLSGENGERFAEAAKKGESVRELVASFAVAARKVKNSIRCSPVGVPTPFLIYVGSECKPEDGKVIYQRLMRDFPNHECERNCDSFGFNATQRLMKEMNLMEWTER